MLLRTVLLAAALVMASCGHGQPPLTPGLQPSGPRLPPPPPGDPNARGAAYLASVAAVLQPAWGQFLEDCRLRLPKEHPLNVATLSAGADIAIAKDGKIAVAKIAVPSGNGDFDTAAFDVLGDVSPLPAPPADLRSDDDLVHLRWLFARDSRQAGAATAQVVNVELPLLGVVDQLLKGDQLVRAMQRVAAAPPSDVDRIPAAERVMIATLRAAVTSPNGAVRRAAIDAIARANVQPLAYEVHRLVVPITDTDLRIAAIRTAAALGNPDVAVALGEDLRNDLAMRPHIALAKIQALATLGRGADALAAIRAEAPNPAALAALAFVPDPEAIPKLAGWFARDTKTRAAVCTALPAASPGDAPGLIARGLRDGDASVRAACVEAAQRMPAGKPDPALLRRLHELVRDRDRAVRARAVAALAVLDPTHRDRAFEDPAPEVRVAAVTGAPENELRTLAADRDPDVRAAAIAALADRAPDLGAVAARDAAPQVRRAAVSAIADAEVLGRLATDDAPDVAMAALIRIAAHRGRGVITGPFLAQLAATPPNSVERVRIALAWLLAR